jgi:hypothetical protein
MKNEVEIGKNPNYRLENEEAKKAQTVLFSHSPSTTFLHQSKHTFLSAKFTNFSVPIAPHTFQPLLHHCN